MTRRGPAPRVIRRADLRNGSKALVTFNAASMTQYLVVYERDGASRGAYSPDLPGCVAAGETRGEVETLPGFVAA